MYEHQKNLKNPKNSFISKLIVIYNIEVYYTLKANYPTSENFIHIKTQRACIKIHEAKEELKVCWFENYPIYHSCVRVLQNICQCVTSSRSEKTRVV